jgi:hypothetical protein
MQRTFTRAQFWKGKNKLFSNQLKKYKERDYVSTCTLQLGKLQEKKSTEKMVRQSQLLLRLSNYEVGIINNVVTQCALRIESTM